MRILSGITFLLLSSALLAHETHDDMTRTRIQIDARASAEVDNDTMRAVLFAEMEDVDSAKLADRINRTTSEVLRGLRNTSGLKVRSGSYNTYPVSEKGKILRWRSRSEIVVEGEDFKRVSEAIGRAQHTLSLASISFFVSASARAKTESELTQASINEFLLKAKLVASSFDGATYHVAEAAVSSDGGTLPPPMPMMRSSMASSDAVAAPDLQAGTTRITVTVAGAILIPR